MESGNLIWLMRVYPVLTIVSRAGMIQELVMIRGGLLCMSTDDFTHNDVPALIEHFCVEWFYTFMCFSSSLSSFFLGTSRLAYDLCVMLNGPNSFAARAFPRTALASLGELTTFSQYLLTADISIKKQWRKPNDVSKHCMRKLMRKLICKIFQCKLFMFCSVFLSLW